jgi:hypothetical protein
MPDSIETSYPSVFKIENPLQFRKTPDELRASGLTLSVDSLTKMAGSEDEILAVACELFPDIEVEYISATVRSVLRTNGFHI